MMLKDMKLEWRNPLTEFMVPLIPAIFVGLVLIYLTCTGADWDSPNEDTTSRRRIRYEVGGQAPAPAPGVYVRDANGTYHRVDNNPKFLTPAQALRRINGHMPYAGDNEYMMPLYIKGTDARYYHDQHMPYAGED